MKKIICNVCQKEINKDSLTITLDFKKKYLRDEVDICDSCIPRLESFLNIKFVNDSPFEN